MSISDFWLKTNYTHVMLLFYAYMDKNVMLFYPYMVKKCDVSLTSHIEIFFKILIHKIIFHKIFL